MLATRPKCALEHLNDDNITSKKNKHREQEKVETNFREDRESGQEADDEAEDRIEDEVEDGLEEMDTGTKDKARLI